MRSFEEVYATLPATGWLTKDEAQLLWESALKLKGERFLEVGCYHGRSTVLLAELAGRLHCVDPFKGFDSADPEGLITRRAFLRNLTERNISNVQLWQVPIGEWQILKVQFAYLDGDHTYEGTQTQLAAAQMAGAKTICVHDVNDTGDGAEIKRACLELLGPWTTRVGRLAVWGK